MDKLLVIFQSIFKRRDLKVLLSFSLIPIITPFLMNNNDIETLASSEFTSSLLAFIAGAIDTQYKLLIPSLIIGFITCSVFGDEIDSKLLFLYKDVNRDIIYRSKIMGLFMSYGFYLILSLLTSCIAYFLVVCPKWGLSPALIPNNMSQLQGSLLSILSTISLNLITILIISALSLRKGALASVLFGILFVLLSMIGEMLEWLQPVFPNGYVNQIDNVSFPVALAMIILLSVIYSAVPYLMGLIKFRKIEY